MKNPFLLILFLYFLALFQASFLVHFPLGYFFNFVLVAIILISLFENPQRNFGLFCALSGGFFLDIFSEKFFGFWVLILVAISLFIKYILKQHVRFPLFQRF